MVPMNGEETTGETTLQVKLDKREQLAVIGLFIGIIGMLCTAALFIFKTNTDAAIEHARIEQKAAVEKALAEERQKNQDKENTDVSKKLDNIQKALVPLHTNQQILMDSRAKTRGSAKPLPASLRMDIE